MSCDKEYDFECDRCGHQFEAEGMPFCGHLLKPDNCPECGAPKSEIKEYNEAMRVNSYED